MRFVPTLGVALSLVACSDLTGPRQRTYCLSEFYYRLVVTDSGGAYGYTLTNRTPIPGSQACLTLQATSAFTGFARLEGSYAVLWSPTDTTRIVVPPPLDGTYVADSLGWIVIQFPGAQSWVERVPHREVAQGLDGEFARVGDGFTDTLRARWR